MYFRCYIAALYVANGARRPSHEFHHGRLRGQDVGRADALKIPAVPVGLQLQRIHMEYSKYKSVAQSMDGGKIDRNVGPAIRVDENFLEVDLAQHVVANRRERIVIGRDDRYLRFVRLCRRGHAGKAAAPNEDGKEDGVVGTSEKGQRILQNVPRCAGTRLGLYRGPEVDRRL